MSYTDGLSDAVSGALAAPSAASGAVSLTIDSSVLIKPLTQITAATAALEERTAEIARRLDVVDVSLYDITGGIERLREQNELTTTSIHEVKRGGEQAKLNSAKHHAELKKLIGDRDAVAARNNGERSAAMERDRQLAAEYRERQLEDSQAAHEIRVAEAANIQEAVSLFRDLFGGIAAANRWVGRTVKGIGFECWVVFFLACLMVGIKVYEMKGQDIARPGTPETMTVLARNPGWEKLLQDPRPVLEKVFKGKK